MNGQNKLSLETALNRLKEIHGNLYDYSQVVEFKGVHTKIPVRCKKHDVFFYPTFANHTHSKSGCPVCGQERRSKTRADSYEIFVKKARKTHGSLYNYPKFKYINSQTKVDIECTRCSNIFSQRISMHIKGNGCPNCALKDSALSKFNREKSRTVQETLKEFEKIHKKRYEYFFTDLPKYQHTRIKIKCQCTCIFEMTVKNHLRGHGCPTCGKEVAYCNFRHKYSDMFLKDNSHTHLYIIQMFNDEELFFKVGISKNYKNRFRQLKSSGYRVKPLLLVKSQVNDILKMETILIEFVKNLKIIPAVKFAGYTECFSNIDGILDHIPFDQIEVITNLLSQQEIAA